MRPQDVRADASIRRGLEDAGREPGLYNGFLAAGLIWGLSLGASGWHVKIFFLSCVIVAGVYGAWTVNRKILFIQAVPAIVALIVLHVH